jgi:transcription antitermination factor NusG
MIIPAAVSIIEMDELFRKMEKAEAEFKVLKEVADREADERERLEREAIAQAEAEGQAPPPPALERGALVRIKAGPFTNHTATVSDIDYDAETVSPL